MNATHPGALAFTARPLLERDTGGALDEETSTCAADVRRSEIRILVQDPQPAVRRPGALMQEFPSPQTGRSPRTTRPRARYHSHAVGTRSARVAGAQGMSATVAAAHVFPVRFAQGAHACEGGSEERARGRTSAGHHG